MIIFSTVLFLVINLHCLTAREIPSPPRIVKQPPTDEVLFQVGTGSDENDKPFYIECEALGEPVPKYRWVKNGKNFDWQTYDDRISQQSGRGTLSITKPANDDIGQYQCFAENEWGVATSNSVFMRKAELNNFKKTPPLRLTGNEGEPFKLSCQPPDGWPKPKVYWMIQYLSDGFKSINNSRMTLDPEGNLWFSNLTREDASDNFMYACAASSSTKLEYKLGNRVMLEVVASGTSSSYFKHEPVHQYVSRKNEVALRGKSVELFCIFGGTPLPQTVWSKNGRHIQSSDRITQGNYGKSLIIKLVDFDDEGSYTCEVSNGVGEAKSYSISLEVLAVPYFTEEPEFITAAEDETVEFRCAASGVPEPQIKWIHNGKPIAEAPPNARRKVGTNNIIIERVNKKDTGNYGCNATNSLGYVYKDVYINVLALAPEINEPPRDSESVDGKDINMTCKVYGAPKPEVKWIHNTKTLTGGRYTVLESGDLHISNVQFGDSGQYICHAENKFGNDTATANFVVREHTEITDGPEDYEVEAKTQATFRCKPKYDKNLDLKILWKHNGQQIDYEGEPRFVKASDYSLTILSTNELDSGTYTCVAQTQLDEAEASATLIVQDFPNSPEMRGIQCYEKDATINWMPMGDNRAPILRYRIEYNTSFSHKWEIMNDQVPPGDMSYNVPMSPWANYTFRVIAINKIGPSKPSDHSAVCTTTVEVPHKNPDNVEGKGTQPDNLVISWTKMPQIEHNAPGFYYKVFWKEDIRGTEYQTRDVHDWETEQITIYDQQSFTQYRIKVVAMNNEGEANVGAKEVIGYSGENKPMLAPGNFTLIQIQSPTAALLSWNPVPIESVRGHFRGYKIRTWAENRVGHREIQVQGEATKALVNNFIPFSKNFAQVYVYNDQYNGPRSETLSFDMPEGVPGAISSLQAYPLGSTAFYLSWKPPDLPNGILTGYRIFYAEVIGTRVETIIERKPNISDPDQLHAKLGGLEPNVNYRLYIAAVTAAGTSPKYFIERQTKAVGPVRPSEPDFLLTRIPTNTKTAKVKVTWLPNLIGKPGSYFFVKYRKKGESAFVETERIFDVEYVYVSPLELDQTYEFILVASDGKLLNTPGKLQEIDTFSTGPVFIQPSENVASAGWFIGMMLAIAFLLLLLIIVCIVKRNRGGKYAVHEREQANGRRDYPDEGGFHEYSQPLDNKSHGRASMSSEPKVGPESDTDSMAEYGEADTEGMNEDGSFIGQYGRKSKPGETTSQGFATLV